MMAASPNARHGAKVFAFLKTSFRNHARSLVQKHVFASKRTGREPAQTSSCQPSLEPGPGKPCHVSLNDADHGFQLGREDDSFKRHEFLEELRATLTAEEDEVLENLLNEPFCVAGAIVEADVPPHRSSRKLPDKFLKARASIRRKCRAILMPSLGVAPHTEGHEQSPASGDLCTFGGANYGDTKGQTGTVISPVIRGRACGGGQASDGGSGAAKEQNLAATPAIPTQQFMSSPQSRPTPAWQPRERVISFRISKDQATAMERFFWDNAMGGVGSVNKLARKIALDFIEGRLQYENPRDAEVDWGMFVRKAKRS
jgi:hypothetical protein